MKSKKILKIISIVCSVLLIIASIIGLIIGISSINEEGFGRLGMLLLVPSAQILIPSALNLLITLVKFKGVLLYCGLVYCLTTTLIKIWGILKITLEVIFNSSYQNPSSINGLLFYTILTILLIYPSVFNTCNLIKAIKKKTKTIKKK